jgi:hypothetical protein
MALNIEPGPLWEECHEAIEWHKKRMNALKMMVENYQTPWHRGVTDRAWNGSSTGMMQFDSRNHAFEYIALTISSVVFDNPKWLVTAKRGYAAEVDAPALQDGLNRWTQDIKLRRLLSKFYVDYSFGLSTCLLRQEPEPGSREANLAQLKHRPMPRRLGTSRSFIDPRCFDREDTRFAGHLFIKDKEDLLDMAKDDPDSGWNFKVIQGIAIGSGIDDIRTKDTTFKARDREEIALIEVHVPEHELPDDDPFWKDVPDNERDNYHGTVFTLPMNGVADPEGKMEDYPRAPYAFYGPSNGPYYFGGTYYVPDDPLPLSNLLAVEGQNRQNNAAARALFQAIIEYKKLIVTSSKSPRLAGLVRRAKHGEVVSADLQDLTRMLQQVEVGGPTPSLESAAAYLQDSLDRSSGINENYRGQVTDATATASSIAQAGTSARLAYPRQQFLDFVADVGWGAAWYMHKDDRVKIDLDGGAGTMLGGPPDAHRDFIVQTLQGKGIPEQMAHQYVDFAEKQYRETPFETFDFKIEPTSTGRASDPGNQQRIMSMVPMLENLMMVAVQAPWFNTQEVLHQIGQAYDFPQIEKVLNPAILKQAQAMMMHAQANEGAPPEAQASTGQPRMARDITTPPPAPSHISKPPGRSGVKEPKFGNTAPIAKPATAGKA